MTHWKEYLTSYLNYSRTERNGVTVLLVILLLIIAFNLLFPYIFREKNIDFSQYEKEISRFYEAQEKAKDSLEKLYSSNKYKQSGNTGINLNPIYFDPNNLPEEKWEAIGLSEAQIKVIKNYEAKGGRFLKKEDLGKIYSISQEEYAILEPYIQIQPAPNDNFTKENSISQITPFPFDPNNMTRADWERLGLREKLINTLMNYTNKGGRFYSVDDFHKIYGLRDEEFIVLKPYLKFPVDTVSYSSLSDEKEEILLVDINKADTLDLQQLKGIGPSYAKRIVKYREMLGGYAYPKQLLEIYGMDSSRYAGFIDHIFITNDSILKININKATIKDLIKHPYIEFYLAKSIIAHREKIGSYNRLDELLDARLIYRELYEKIAPYLTVNDSGD